MTTRTTEQLTSHKTYTTHIVLVIISAVLLIAGIWVWFGQKQSQIDSKIYKTSHQLTNINSVYETGNTGSGHDATGKNMDAFYISYYRYSQSGE